MFQLQQKCLRAKVIPRAKVSLCKNIYFIKKYLFLLQTLFCKKSSCTFDPSLKSVFSYILVFYAIIKSSCTTIKIFCNTFWYNLKHLNLSDVQLNDGEANNLNNSYVKRQQIKPLTHIKNA